VPDLNGWGVIKMYRARIKTENETAKLASHLATSSLRWGHLCSPKPISFPSNLL
jgi:hypothetical protein